MPADIVEAIDAPGVFAGDELVACDSAFEPICLLVHVFGSLTLCVNRRCHFLETMARLARRYTP